MPGFHTQIAHLNRLVRALETNVIDLNQRIKLLENQNKDLRKDWRDLIKKVVKPSYPDFKPSSPMPRRSYLEIHPDDRQIVEAVIQAVLQLGPGVYSIPYLHSLFPLFPNLSPQLLSKILKDYPEYFRSFRARSAG